MWQTARTGDAERWRLDRESGAKATARHAQRVCAGWLREASVEREFAGKRLRLPGPLLPLSLFLLPLSSLSFLSTLLHYLAYSCCSSDLISASPLLSPSVGRVVPHRHPRVSLAIESILKHYLPSILLFDVPSASWASECPVRHPRR